MTCTGAAQAGVVSTGNSLDFVDSDMQIMLSYKTAVKEMEANAVAWVVRLCLLTAALCSSGMARSFFGDAEAHRLERG